MTHKVIPTEGKYILKGKKAIPVFDLIKWGKWFEKNHRMVKKTDIKGVHISTVFLGLDHNFSRIFNPKAKPLIFETMIFDTNKKYGDYQERYSTWNEAVKGHNKAVKLVKGEK